jgi:hypothetical protein
MKRPVLTACACVFILLGASQVRALPFFDDPGVVYALAIVNGLLKTIEQAELTLQLSLQKGIRGLVADLGFPEGLFSELQETLGLVKGIRDEIAELSCGWKFSPRTLLLKDLYRELRILCRQQYEGVWGTPVGGNQDLEEFRNYVGTLTTNMISERVDRSEGWRQMFPAMEEDTALARVSPGDASRDEAVSVAGTALIADSNSGMATESLLLEQAETSAERLEDRRARDVARFILRDTAGLDPWNVP